MREFWDMWVFWNQIGDMSCGGGFRRSCESGVLWRIWGELWF